MQTETNNEPLISNGTVNHTPIAQSSEPTQIANQQRCVS